MQQLKNELRVGILNLNNKLIIHWITILKMIRKLNYFLNDRDKIKNTSLALKN